MPLPSSRPGELTVVSRAPGRVAGEDRVVLAGPTGATARGLWFAGRPGAGLRAWVDLVVDDLALIAPVAARLDPGDAIMIAYGDDETERALRRRVPPAATPLGLALIAAGCRWLKDWSFAEGGREGGTKLQGELPLDAEHAREAARRLDRELEAFLRDPDARGGDHDLACAARRALAGDPANQDGARPATRCGW